MKTLCLTFIKVISSLQNPVPDNVDQIIKSQVAQQFLLSHPNQKLLFDEPNCELKGSYTFSNSSLIMEADHTGWSGNLELSFDDLLAGRKISFARVSPIKRLFRTPETLGMTTQKPESAVPILLKASLATAVIIGIVSILKNSVEPSKISQPKSSRVKSALSNPKQNAPIQIQESSKF